MSLPTPPRYVVIPEEVIEQAYRPDKPRRALLASFTRILSLAWESKYERTPAMNEEELMNFLKLSRRQYYEQRADMELLGWLRSSHPRPGFVQFSFSRSITEKVAPDPSAENRTDGAESRTDASLLGGGESLINLTTDPPTPPLNGNGSAENRTFPGVIQILQHTDKLFDGSVVRAKGLEKCSPLEALAWCAYAYFNKRKLDGPAGLVRRRLLDGEDAPLWTTEQWPEVLPADFLEALGLITYVCDDCQAKFGTRAEFEAHELTHPPVEEPPEVTVSVETDESVKVPIDGRMNAQQAWQSILGQLQMEMPRASFDTWVRGSKAVRFHGNVLSIGVRNAYARDWLESRIRSTAERLVVGILARSVSVVFVVAQLEPDHD
jgi:hypothetical protein